MEILNTVTNTILKPKLHKIKRKAKMKQWGNNIGDYIKTGDLIAVLETEEFTVDIER